MLEKTPDELDGIDRLAMLPGQIGKTLQILRSQCSENLGNGSLDHTSCMTELMI